MVINYKMTDIGIFPEDWEIVPFCDVFVFLSNNTLSRNQLNYNGGTVKNIHYGDVLILYPELLDCTRDDIPYVNEKEALSCSTLEDGDIIFADTAEDGTVGKVTEIFNTQDLTVVSGLHTITCRVKDKKFAPGWLGYFLNSHFYHDQLLPYIHGTKVSSISKDSLCDTYIAMPSYDEQIEIVKALSNINAFIDKSEKLGKKYQSLKQACLQHMFPRMGQTEPDVRLPGFTDPWEQRKLGDVSSVYDGVHKTPEYKENGIMFLSVENISTLKSEKYISEEDFKKDYKVYPEKNDILMTRIGDVGTPNIVKTDEKLAFYVSLALLKPYGVDSYFLNSEIQAPFFQYGLRERTLLTAIPMKINKDEIGEINIFLPQDMEEQRRIGFYFQKMDNLITLHQRTCEKYKNIKQGIMEELLSGKIRLV